MICACTCADHAPGGSAARAACLRARRSHQRCLPRPRRLGRTTRPPPSPQFRIASAAASISRGLCYGTHRPLPCRVDRLAWACRGTRGAPSPRSVVLRLTLPGVRKRSARLSMSMKGQDLQQIRKILNLQVGLPEFVPVVLHHKRAREHELVPVPSRVPHGAYRMGVHVSRAGRAACVMLCSAPRVDDHQGRRCQTSMSPSVVAGGSGSQPSTSARRAQTESR